MKFTHKLTVTGMKRFKGTVEGVDYDSTKVYALTDLDDSKGNGAGQATVEYQIGTSQEFEKLKHLSGSFPLECEAEVEIVTNGKTQKTTISSLRPVGRSSAAAKA